MAWDTALAKLQYRKICDIISSPLMAKRTMAWDLQSSLTEDCSNWEGVMENVPHNMYPWRRFWLHCLHSFSPGTEHVLIGRLVSLVTLPSQRKATLWSLVNYWSWEGRGGGGCVGVLEQDLLTLTKSGFNEQVE